MCWANCLSPLMSSRYCNLYRLMVASPLPFVFRIAQSEPLYPDLIVNCYNFKRAEVALVQIADTLHDMT